jgi:hypothetical protein
MCDTEFGHKGSKYPHTRCGIVTAPETSALGMHPSRCFPLARFIKKEICMDTRSTVQSLMEVVQMGNFEKAKSYFPNDFQFSGPVPEPISAHA